MRSGQRTGRRRAFLLGAVVATALALVGVQAAWSASAVAKPTITTAPAVTTSQTTATLAFTGPRGATFACRLDAAPFATCASPLTYTGLAQGQHTFAVKAVVGKAESAVTTATWTVDTSPPPAPTLTTRPAALTNNVDAVLGYTDSEAGVSFRCSLDGAAPTACGSSAESYGGLRQGQHSFAVRAVDKAGNASAPTSYTWVVDTTAPAAPTLTGKPTNPTENATNVFTWTGSESPLTYRCSLENGAWAACSSPYTWMIATGSYGQHQFAVRAVDAAGNVSTATTYVFKYQKGLPTTGVPFRISGTAGPLAIGVTRPIAVTVTNPNPVQIYVSALSVAVSADSTPSGCSSAANIALTQSSVSPTNRLVVPANGSVTLPAQGSTAPTITLRNLPTVNQDVCKNKTFTLTYSGTATN